MRTYEAVVEEVVRETPDTATLRLGTGPLAEGYRPGQFLTVDPFDIPAVGDMARELGLRKGRREKPRAYSLASAPHEPHLAITVKEEAGAPDSYPALLSPWMVHRAKAGDRFPIAGFAGVYTLPKELSPDDRIVHLCAGSGIVPNFSILKDVLHRGVAVRQTLVYSVRTRADIIYREALERLERESGGRLEVLYALTREPGAPGLRAVGRRVDAALLRAHVPEPEKTWFYLCGPAITREDRAAARAAGREPEPRFVESVRALLHELGVARTRVHTEGW